MLAAAQQMLYVRSDTVSNIVFVNFHVQIIIQAVLALALAPLIPHHIDT